MAFLLPPGIKGLRWKSVPPTSYLLSSVWLSFHRHCEKCSNAKSFLIRIQLEHGEVRTRKNSVFGYFSPSETLTICKTARKNNRLFQQYLLFVFIILINLQIFRNWYVVLYLRWPPRSFNHNAFNCDISTAGNSSTSRN